MNAKLKRLRRTKWCLHEAQSLVLAHVHLSTCRSIQSQANYSRVYSKVDKTIYSGIWSELIKKSWTSKIKTERSTSFGIQHVSTHCPSLFEAPCQNLHQQTEVKLKMDSSGLPEDIYHNAFGASSACAISRTGAPCAAAKEAPSSWLVWSSWDWLSQCPLPQNSWTIRLNV